MLFPLIPSFVCLALYFPAASSFSVVVGSSPTQCGSLDVTWTGGQAPFEILLTPVFDIPRNVSVPSTSFQNNKGSFQLSPISFPQGTQFLLTMSDATGFGTGGTTDLLNVGAPEGGASCNTSSPSIPFSFSLPSALQQCNPYIFNGYDGATLPVTITGLIPGGDSFLLHSAETSYTWVADVAAGTTIIFTMTDALGRSGGSSDTETVALSNDATCLNASSPTSTMSTAPPSTSAASSSTPSPTQASGVSTGTIVGAAVGAVVAVTAIVALVIFYLKRQRFAYGPAPTRKSRRPNSVELDSDTDNFQHPQIYPFPYQADSVSHLAPPILPGSPPTTTSRQETSYINPSLRALSIPSAPQQHSRTNSNTDSFAAFGDIGSSTMSSSARQKAAMAGSTSHQPTTRFIVHTDADDHIPEDVVEVVELPPQYSERRAPAITHAGGRPVSSATGISSVSLPYLSGQHMDDPTHSTPHPLE